ncbi:MAG: MFS transporter [Bacteroidales bacterium]
MGFNKSIFSKFPQTFWVANSIELFERWAWYGFYMLFANYLTGSADVGGLELSQIQKGTIMGVGTSVLYLLPILTGSIADRYGYKNVLIVAFIVYVSAFISIPYFKSFAGVFSIFLYLAVGAALFKPVISATIAKTTTDETSSIGFGIFYMMVNIGAFLGPLITLVYRDTSQWIFYISAGFIMINFILLYFYKVPSDNILETKENLVFLKILKTLAVSILLFVSAFAIFLIFWILDVLLYYLNKGKKISRRWTEFVISQPIGDSNRKIFENITGIFFDTRFILFLFIVSGFWTMYYQLFYTLPVFISQWVDTSVLYDFFNNIIPFITRNYSTVSGQLDAEFIINFDALYIILFQVLVSTLIMKLKPLHSMTIGFIVCTVGMALTLLSQNVLFTIVSLLIFGLGEMSASPKITEYIGRIAPADKKGVYMGYSFIPVFIGSLLAGLLSGEVYQSVSDKTMMVKNEAAKMGLSLNPSLSINESFAALAKQTNMTPSQLNTYLWDKYQPSDIWMVIFAIGFAAVIALYFYNRYAFSKTGD